MMPRFSYAVNDLAQYYKLTNSLAKSKSSSSIKKTSIMPTNLSYSMLAQKMNRRRSLKELHKNVECKSTYEGKQKSLPRKKEKLLEHSPNVFKFNKVMEGKTNTFIPFFRHVTPGGRKNKATLTINVNNNSLITKNSIDFY